MRHPLLRRRVLHALAASVVLELLVDLFAVAAGELLAPLVGDWVLVVAAVIVFGTLPFLMANVARIARSEVRRHHRAETNRDES